MVPQNRGAKCRRLAGLDVATCETLDCAITKHFGCDIAGDGTERLGILTGDVALEESRMSSGPRGRPKTSGRPGTKGWDDSDVRLGETSCGPQSSTI